MSQGPRHICFDKNMNLPLQILDHIGNGGEARIKTVRVQDQYDGFPFVCILRTLTTTYQNLEKHRKSFLREVHILAKFREETHIITLLGSYERDLEFGVLHLPRAHCDLKKLLSLPKEERQKQMPDGELEKGLGCLTTALYTLHDAKIRHKDIKPANILVNGKSLVLADFGCSIDFSEANDSQTSGYIEGTTKYLAPEIKNDRPRGCATDVFALGCVFLEILSVLDDVQTTDEKSCSPSMPYRYKLHDVQVMLEKWKTSNSNNPARQFWIEASQLMVAEHASFRPRLSNVMLQLRYRKDKGPEHFSNIACTACIEGKVMKMTNEKLDELKRADFIWKPNKDRLVEYPIPLAERLQNSNGGISYGILRLMSSVFTTWVTRWSLTVYLDNGRPLRSYGILPVSVNYEYDFGDLLVDRIVFEPGTFANEVDLYRKSNWDKGNSGHCFRTGACDKPLDEPLCIRSYRVVWR